MRAHISIFSAWTEGLYSRVSAHGCNSRPRAGRGREASQSSSGPYEAASVTERHRLVAGMLNCSDVVQYVSRSGSHAGITIFNRLFERGTMDLEGARGALVWSGFSFEHQVVMRHYCRSSQNDD